MADTGCAIVPVETGGFLMKVMEMKEEHFRIMQAHAVSTENGYELSYTFGRDYEWTTLRLVIGEDEDVPTITNIYPAAFLYENEMAELFGVRIKMVEPDFHDKLYRIKDTTPMKKL